jgi:hypothetical protein
MRNITMENFCALKKYTPSEQQLSLVDSLIDSMDLSSKKSKTDKDDNDDDEEDELCKPELVFNPYIQRMFQSIAVRAADPTAELPDFDAHMTNTYLTRTNEKVRTQAVQQLLKRCVDEFPTRAGIKKAKKDQENIFDKQRQEESNGKGDDNASDQTAPDVNGGEDRKVELDALLNGNSNFKKVKKVGTISPAEDFKVLAERLLASASSSATLDADFADLCIQIQRLASDLFAEALVHLSEEDAIATVRSFQQKVVDCVRVQRGYCVRFSAPGLFNAYLRSFKANLVAESSRGRNGKAVEAFWTEFFADQIGLSLITQLECDEADAVSDEEAREFVAVFRDIKTDVDGSAPMQDEEEKEDVEDLLDMM